MVYDRRKVLGLKRSTLSAGLRLRRVGTIGSLAVLALPCCALSEAAARVVQYRGMRVVVPASWRVYRLSPGSRTCVRFDRHALYLGRPSSQQRCPAHAVGRTEA